MPQFKTIKIPKMNYVIPVATSAIFFLLMITYCSSTSVSESMSLECSTLQSSEICLDPHSQGFSYNDGCNTCNCVGVRIAGCTMIACSAPNTEAEHELCRNHERNVKTALAAFIQQKKI